MSSPKHFAGPWDFCLSFDVGPFSDAAEIQITGTLPDCVARIESELKTAAPRGAFLSWPIGSGTGGLQIGDGQTLADAIEQADAELFDPDVVFSDPAEETAARLHVGAIAKLISGS
jgi:hypothetical protein